MTTKSYANGLEPSAHMYLDEVVMNKTGIIQFLLLKVPLLQKT